MEDVLPTIAMPCLLFAGEADPRYPGAKKAVNYMPNASFVSLPGLDHYQVVGSDLVLPHVKKFLAAVSKEVTQA
jgi:pimeloyl-ACP methyl ester carboxylesterase